MSYMVLSQEDHPRTHSTNREISHKTSIAKSSVVRIIRKDLQLKCFKRRCPQELTQANCTAGKLLLKKFFQFAADFIFFTDDICKKTLQFIHTVNGDGSKTAKMIKRHY